MKFGEVDGLQRFRRDGMKTLRGRRAVGWQPTEVKEEWDGNFEGQTGCRYCRFAAYRGLGRTGLK